MKKSLFLFAVSTLVLGGCSNNTPSSSTTSGTNPSSNSTSETNPSSNSTSETSSSSNSTSEKVEITAEKWDAAFEEAIKNYTYKETRDNKPMGILKFTENGYHMESYSYSGTTTVKYETYVEWTADKTYYYSNVSGKWVKEEDTSDYVSKDYNLFNAKASITFIGRFSDFSYNEEKGGYFAEKSKTTEVELNDKKYGNLEMSNVLVKFDKYKISEVTTSNTSLTSIGSTTFAFPTVSE